MSNKQILYENEFVHIVNNESGEVELLEGPRRFQLPAHKSVRGSKQQKLVLKDNQYVVVSNPFDKESGKNKFGESVVLTGPRVFSLYPDEKTDGVKDAILLSKSQYLFVQAIDDANNVKAGELSRITGPCLYFPQKHERTVGSVKEAVQLGDNEALYVRNVDTSDLHLVRGPCAYMLGVNEEEFLKPLPKEAYAALDIPATPQSKAYQINVQKNEVVCVENLRDHNEQYVMGPRLHILQPYEEVRVTSLSAGVPKEENGIKAVKINLGPDLMIDSFNVRTKDNAVLNLVVSYKWRFALDDKDLYKVFAGDFIGYACQSMRSRVREAASRCDFEVFHTSSSQILRNTLFKDYEIPLDGKTANVNGRFFREYNFLIFSLDVKSVKPVDSEIERLLDESIKTSMTIMCRKLNDSAETALEVDRITSEAEVEKLKSQLISIENANYVKEMIETARIEGKAMIEKAIAEQQAEQLLTQSKQSLELEQMRKTIELLQGPGGSQYLEFVKVTSAYKQVSHATLVPNEVKTLKFGGATQGNSSSMY